MLIRHAMVGAIALATAACQSDEKPVEVVPVPGTVPVTSTTAPAPLVDPSADMPEAPTTTTTTEPPYDWGPVICPSAPHPAHHEPCRARIAETAAYEAPSPQSQTVRPASGWVIPDYIVQCESGGSWGARNPSGAAGPYQLMPEHFGGESALNQSREAQHAKAAELWDGGRGAHHWEQCL